MITREETQARLDRRSAAAARFKPRSTFTIADRLEEHARAHGERPFLLYGDTVLSYAEVDARASQVAHAARALGLKCGDVCALAMENRPELFIAWFGLNKLGVTVALLNTHNRGRPLRHAIDETRARAVIVGEECLAAFDTAETRDLQTLWLWPDAEQSAGPALRALAVLDFAGRCAGAPRSDPDRAWRDGLVAEMPAVLVFTSGTTGLPKAAIYSHMRWMMVGDVTQATMDSDERDVFYCFLPLYHGAAAAALASTALHSGSAIVIRRRFSVREFWSDVRRYHVTYFQYVGEIIRYLLNQPPRPDDRQHTLRVMAGTGMGPELWARWVARFGEPMILESWGATESNANVVNVDNRPGSCGRVPFWEKTNLRLIRYDVERGEHLRDAAGHYVVCQPGEVGEAVGFIVDHPDIGAGRFEGYTSKEATEKKILRNVFRSGDAWWASGDLLYYDADGYLWFVDRIGDTFRWKSENVSTTEVAETLGGFPGIESINVYGVQVPGMEGRCGMAAILVQPGETFDPAAFFRFAAERLPRYALPQFLRLSDKAELTTTFKLRKFDLQRQGYDPAAFSDPLYVIDEAGRSYRPYSAAALAAAGFPPFAP
ncbi:MAG: long-chain-acyl-CoA synthetase [Steroidobacteraceae bacterium]